MLSGELPYGFEVTKARTRPPLIERNPVIFWKSVSFVLLLAVIVLGAVRLG